MMSWGSSAIERFWRWLTVPDRNPPKLLLDPDGEGIYVLEDWRWLKGGSSTLRTAAYHLNQLDDQGRLDWRNIDSRAAWMTEGDDDHWVPADIGRWPKGWRLNLLPRWRAVAYAYCTPKPEADCIKGSMQDCTKGQS